MTTRKEVYLFLSQHAREHNLMNNASFLSASKTNQDIGGLLVEKFNLDRSKANELATQWGLFVCGMPGYEPSNPL